MKKRLITACKWFFGIAAPVIITALITGQPLTGLVKLRGLVNIFVKSSVSAWAFTLTFVAAVLGGLHFVEHFRQANKGTLHFVPDAHNCYWGQAGQKRGGTILGMFVNMGGTFTYDGDKDLKLLAAYFKGTHPVSDMLAQISYQSFNSPSGVGIYSGASFELSPHESKRVMVTLQT